MELSLARAPHVDPPPSVEAAVRVGRPVPSVFFDHAVSDGELRDSGPAGTKVPRLDIHGTSCQGRAGIGTFFAPHPSCGWVASRLIPTGGPWATNSSFCLAMACADTTSSAHAHPRKNEPDLF